MATRTYADRLRQALDRDGWSQLRLVKELAARTGNAPESERSAVRGYLRGSTPRPERAKLISEITGLPDLALADDPRRSGAARIEDRLAELAKNDDEILANQELALQGQESLLAELRSMREALDTLAGAARTQPRSRRAR